MRFLTGIVLGLLLCAAVHPVAAARETYEVDPTHSAAMFKVSHFGISFVTGSFTGVSGTIRTDRDNPHRSSVEIIVQTATVDTHVKQRDDHLRNADFLDVEKYPTMKFKSRKVKKLEDDLYEVTGAFSLHGVTRNITTRVKFIGETDVPWGQHRAGFETSFSIKRSDYGMDKLLTPAGDKIEITILIEAMRKDDTEKKTSG